MHEDVAGHDCTHRNTIPSALSQVSNVWLSASQTKGLAGIKQQTQIELEQQFEVTHIDRTVQNGGDAFSQIKRELLGKKVDENA